MAHGTWIINQYEMFHDTCAPGMIGFDRDGELLARGNELSKCSLNFLTIKISANNVLAKVKSAFALAFAPVAA